MYRGSVRRRIRSGNRVFISVLEFFQTGLCAISFNLLPHRFISVQLRRRFHENPIFSSVHGFCTPAHGFSSPARELSSPVHGLSSRVHELRAPAHGLRSPVNGFLRLYADLVHLYTDLVHLYADFVRRYTNLICPHCGRKKRNFDSDK